MREAACIDVHGIEDSESSEGHKQLEHYEAGGKDRFMLLIIGTFFGRIDENYGDSDFLESVKLKDDTHHLDAVVL